MKLKSHKKTYLFLYIFIAIALLVSAYNFIFINRILPGVYLNGVSFGGLDKEQAYSKMTTVFPKDTKVVISNNGNNYSIAFTSLDLNYNKDATYEKMFKKGRENFFSQFFYIPGLLTKKSDINFEYSVSEGNLDLELATLSAQIFPKVKNANFVYTNDALDINEAGSGKVINLQELKKDIVDNLKYGKTKYVATTTDFVPNVYKKDLETIKPNVEKLLKEKLVLEYKDEKYSPENSSVIKFFEFNNVNGKVVAVANNLEIENYVNDISSKINQEPKSIDFKLDDKKVITSFTPPTNGRDLDRESTKKQITDSLLNYFNNNQELKPLALSVKEISPDPNSNEYGITELFAEGVSYFSHSIPSRVSNIKTAGEKINGTLVAPGEFYSFNDSVGPIDIEHGFNSAYVISKGRTILGTGGGVCQVSSTVFRAALNGGLPITERTAHAYRVSYYEQNSEIGYDATIYQPSVDLKFKNDTEHYLLVTSEVDTENMKMWVRIYGTKDGRTVEVTKPKLGPQLKPPETVYEDDPTLAKGQLVQIEYPAWGGSSVFKQIVKNKDGSIRFENEFKSYYRPWAAVFKKGTKG